MYPFTTSNLDLAAIPTPVRSLNGVIITAGGTASTVVFRNGSVSGPIQFEIKVAANTTESIVFGRAIPFGGGVFIVPDANVSRGMAF